MNAISAPSWSSGHPHRLPVTIRKADSSTVILRDHLDAILPEALDRVLEREARQRRRIAALLRVTQQRR